MPNTFPIHATVRVLGDRARTVYLVDSLPAADNGTVYVTLPDGTQGFWIEPEALVQAELKP